MRRLFGAPSTKDTQPPPSLKETSEKLDDNISSIDVKIKRCNEELSLFKQQLAKAPNSTVIKQRALVTLKRKRMYETQRDQLMSTQFNLDQTQFTTEQLQTTTMAVSSMKAAATSLKKDFNKIRISEVEAIQDDLADLMFEHEDVSESLGRSYYSSGAYVDESELDSEFLALSTELEATSCLQQPSETEDVTPTKLAEDVPAGKQGGASGGGGQGGIGEKVIYPIDADFLTLPSPPNCPLPANSIQQAASKQ